MVHAGRGVSKSECACKADKLLPWVASLCQVRAERVLPFFGKMRSTLDSLFIRVERLHTLIYLGAWTCSHAQAASGIKSSA